MRRGTSVPLNIDVKGYTFDGDRNIEAVVRQKEYVISKTVVPSIYGDNARIEMPLTIQETLGLKEGMCEVQIQWVNSEGQKDASDVIFVDVLRILKEA